MTNHEEKRTKEKVIKSFGNSCRAIGGELSGHPSGKSVCKLPLRGEVELHGKERKAIAIDEEGKEMAEAHNIDHFESTGEGSLKALSWGDHMRTELEIWTW